ncbi:MAG: type II toxin-antitoxin system VapC family toxin, partial [Pseudomonadota bacterium]
SLPVTDVIGKKAGQYLKEFNKSHGLEIADALIAASASHYRMQLWTLNTRHYPMTDIKLFDR